MCFSFCCLLLLYWQFCRHLSFGTLLWMRTTTSQRPSPWTLVLNLSSAWIVLRKLRKQQSVCRTFQFHLSGRNIVWEQLEGRNDSSITFPNSWRVFYVEVISQPTAAIIQITVLFYSTIKIVRLHTSYVCNSEKLVTEQGFHGLFLV